MAKPKEIKCPKCKTRVMTYDGKGKIPLKSKCKRCEKLIVFNPNKDSIDVTNVPKRATSSGVMFY